MGTACSSSAPQRAGGWVSLHPAITETIFALGAEDRLIGRSDYCTYPEQALALPSFGTTLTPEIESLAAARPERVLVDGSYGAKTEAISQVAPVNTLNWLTLADVTKATNELGQWAGKTAEAEALVTAYQTHLSGTPAPDAPTALLLIGSGDLTLKSLWYIKPDSLHGTALASAGFRNVMEAGRSGPPQLSIEQLIALDPEVLLVVSADESKDAVIDALSTLTPLQATRNKRIRVIGGARSLSIGPGIVTLSQQLSAIREAL